LIPRNYRCGNGIWECWLLFCRFGFKAGFQVVAVSDSKRRIKKTPEGGFIPLDIPLVFQCKQEKGSLAGCYCAGGVATLVEAK